jgi:hypothetical protein
MAYHNARRHQKVEEPDVDLEALRTAIAAEELTNLETADKDG